MGSTEAVWQEFSEGLRAFIARRVSDAQDVDDLLQDVFVKIHTRIDSLVDEDRMAPWVYQIARNTIIDYYRQQKPHLELPEDLAVELEIHEPDPAEQIARSLHGMLASLPAKYRHAVQLVELEGAKQAQLAQDLGITLSGAKSRVQRGRVLLRSALLDCCHFEFDRRGHLIDYTSRPDCCEHCQAT